MTKKKPRRPPRPRTTYEVTSDAAQAELDKAVEKRTAILMQLDGLNRRIPWLEGVIRALKQETTAEFAKRTFPVNEPVTYPLPQPQPDPYAPQTFTQPPVATGEPAQLATQEEFLARFMPRPGPLRTTSPVPPAAPAPYESPTAAQTVGNSEDENEFLTGGDGPGVDLLS